MSRRQARRDVFLGRSTQEGNDSRNIGQGESWLQTRGECADWAAGQWRDLRQDEQTFMRQTWLSRGSSKDAAPGEATAAAAVGDLDQGGRQEREATESALAASDPRCRHHPPPIDHRSTHKS